MTPPSRLLDVAIGTDRGLVRHENQDVVVLDGWAAVGDRLTDFRRALPLDHPLVAAVIDGMGGHAGGALAAWMLARRLAVTALGLASSEDAEQLLREVHLEIWNAGHGIGTPEMGAAFAAIVLKPDGYSIFNVGDCRAYRVADGALGQLSIDDSGPSRLEPGRTVLTQSVGGAEPYQIDAHWFAGSYGDATQRFVLASDGLAHADTGAIAEAVLLDDPEAASLALLTAALAVGAPDNVSVLVIDVGAPPHDIPESKADGK